ncbi:MAG: Rpn family recombination-promoting nuclease/putative transposase [Treponema sp.]|nr:Rpn family recombination-promoting nuclease/putative transposase [Treponema sp.]
MSFSACFLPTRKIAKLITEQLGSGDKYKTLQKVISIIITDEDLIQNSPRYHHRFVFYDSEAAVEFSDIIEIHTLELKKLPERDDGTELYDWAKFIAAETEEDLKMAAETNPQIKKAVVKLQELSADERARDLFERREKGRRDMESRERWAEARGEAKEREKWQKIVTEEREKWQKIVAENEAEIVRLKKQNKNKE